MPAEVHKFNDERKVIEACVGGDRQAFEQLYTKYKDKVYGVAYYMCGDQETARDLTQQVFLKAFVSLGSFSFNSRFSTWLLRLAINACIDYRRKNRRVTFVAIDHSIPQMKTSSQTTEEDVLKREIAEAVESAIMRMSKKLREVVVLKYVADLSYAEISETLGCSIGTVGSRLNRGHAFLAEKLHHLKDQA
ncbi:sigma-70 family RNA polymerase sigma factor [bacterium]|nr:sigma-70 family RNA polymerase sigma factor [bacterium]